MKKITLMSMVLSLLHFSIDAQEKEGTKAPSKVRTFRELRRSEFTKLSGSENVFQGFSISYNEDKALLKGSGGIPFGKKEKSIHAIFLEGEIGTTTNLSTLFNQDVLPAYSVQATYNFLLPNWLGTTWRYDNDFDQGSSQQADVLHIQNIKTSRVDKKGILSDIRPSYTNRFKYRQKLQDELKAGKYSYQRLYSFRHVVYFNASIGYKNDKYSFIDLARSFKSQLYDTTFSTMNFQLSLNNFIGWDNEYVSWRYKVKNKWAIYYRPAYIYTRLFVTFKKSNNIKELKKFNVSDIDTVVTSQGTSREVGKNQSYYRGDYYDYFTTTLGAQLSISPINHLSIELLAQRSFIKNKDKEDYSLDNYTGFSAGFFVYTGKEDNFKINLGISFKHQQSALSRKEWANRVELITSIPIAANKP